MADGAYILISGATSDIGREIARTLSGHYPLLLHGRDRSKLEALKAELCSSNAVALWTADLKAPEAVKSSLKAFLTENQIQVSGFVHCAGTHKILPIKTFRQDYMDEIFNVNLFSGIAIIQTLLAKTNVEALGRIVFISALYSKRGNKGNTIYAASKGAIDSFVKSLAMELAPKVNVNSILPGGIRTQMTESLYNDPEKKAALDLRYPIGHGECRDIALMVEYLLGEGGRWITAQNYLVDGGASMS